MAYGRHFGFGTRDAAGVDYSFAGRIDIRPYAAADAGENRGTERRAFFRGHRLDRTAIDVSLNLSPDRRPRTAAAQPDSLGSR